MPRLTEHCPVGSSRVWRAVAVACAIAWSAPAAAQVVNGDFSSGGTGWTTTAPSNSTLSYAGNQLTTVSDNNGGTNSRTYASQTLVTTDPGYLSWLLRSYTSVDVDLGPYDYPTVLVGSTFYWITTGGVLTTTAAAGIDNDNTGITNVTARTTLTAGSRTIGAGVTSTDSQLGAGTAIWDDIDFQELTQSPGAQSTPQNTSLVLSGANAPQIATNTGVATMTVTLTVTNGTLTLASTAGISFTGGANGTATMTFTGSPANINTALNGLVYAPTTGFSGGSTLTFFANSGAISDTDIIAITVVPFTYTVTVGKTRDVASVSALPATITYTITVANTGTGTHVNPLITDTLLQGATSLSLTTGPTLTGGDSDSDGRIDPGETWTYTATYVVTQANMDDGQAITNAASFDSDQTTPQPSGTVSTTINALPSLSITKTANDTTDVALGQTLTYTYVVTNTGNVTIDNVFINDVHDGSNPDPIPSGETLTSDVAPLGDSTDATASNGTWSVLRPGDSVTFTGTYTVTQADIDTL